MNGSKGKGRARRAVEVAARELDRALACAAAPLLDGLDSRNEARALADPQYAEIQARRARGQNGRTAWPDEGLTWGEVAAMRSIRAHTDSHPWWEAPVASLARQPMRSRLRTFIFAWQRLTRGWDDSATWSLDVHLCATLADQLDRLADTSHSWPEGPEYPQYDDWAHALRENAAHLRVYASGRFDTSSFTQPDEIPDVDASHARLESQYANAQEALRWVADNLGSLWD